MSVEYQSVTEQGDMTESHQIPSDVLFKPRTLGDNEELCKVFLNKSIGYAECPQCCRPLKINQQYIVRLADNKTEYNREKVRIVKCDKCFVEYKIELKKTNKYLYVPFNQKNIVKELGASFDPDLKLWYIKSTMSITNANKLLKKFKLVKVNFEALAADMSAKYDDDEYN